MLKLCIWMNIKSQLQNAFFDAAAKDSRVDLKVCYLSARVPEERRRQGFLEEPLRSYENARTEGEPVSGFLARIPDWRERIHVTSCTFSGELVDELIRGGVAWCHWSEMPGIGLAARVGFRRMAAGALLRLLPLRYLAMGWKIRRYALGAFGHGKKAMRFFRQSGIPGCKIAMLCYCTAPVEPAAAAEEITRFAGGKVTFLSMAALNSRKGIDVLIRAFAKLPSDSCLVLCGVDQSCGEYAALAGRLRVADRILFLGACPANETAAVYAAADVLVLASRFDGWGAVLNEAASVGKALISTDMAGAAFHLISEGENGFRVRAGSAEALCAAMRNYVGAPGLCRKHGEVSREIYFREFTPQRNVDRLVETIETWNKSK